jgi:hypothetical protein
MGINDKTPLLAHISRRLGGQFYTQKYQESVRSNRDLALAALVNAGKDPETLLIYLFYAD